MNGYRVEDANEQDFCLICKGKADKKLVGPERTFRFCNECGTEFTALIYQAFGQQLLMENPLELLFIDGTYTYEEDF